MEKFLLVGRVPSVTPTVLWSFTPIGLEIKQLLPLQIMELIPAATASSQGSRTYRDWQRDTSDWIKKACRTLEREGHDEKVIFSLLFFLK